LLYREKKGELTAVKIGRRKYYSIGEVEQLKRNNPVHNKPHWSKRTTQQPTLWNRIKTLVSAFFAKF